MSQLGYYERLGLTKDADQSQIKDAFRKLAMQYHPDRNPDDAEAAEKMKEINEAYAVLSNAEKRAEYDRMRTMFGDRAHDRFRNSYSEQDIFRGTDINEIFETISRMFQEGNFQQMGGNGRTSFYWNLGGNNAPNSDDFKINNVFLRYAMGKFMPMKGGDIKDAIWIEPGLAKSGGAYAYENIYRDKKLVVQLPQNMRDGQDVRLNGMGKSGKNGGPNGDLYLTVRIRKPGLAVLEELKDTAKTRLKKLFKKS